MEVKTFKEWSAEGYKIIKGSKAFDKNTAGESLFTEAQVTPWEHGKLAKKIAAPQTFDHNHGFPTYPESQHAEGFGYNQGGDWGDYEW